MAIFDKLFSKVVVISGDAVRRGRAMSELRLGNLCENPVWQRAVMGKELPPPAWWKAGIGAWGCLCSHRRAIEDAWLEGCESVLVVEDDAVWAEDAADLAMDFFEELPDDWGQIYFGGQHRKQPEWKSDRVLIGRSVNRTHAYALHRRAMPKFLQHIQHAPDYMASAQNGKAYHIDHQLETAHQRRDWKVYAPSWWLAGQGENLSSINNNAQRESWWHYDWSGNCKKMPLIVTRSNHYDKDWERRLLWYGKHLLDGGRVDLGVLGAADDAALVRVLQMIAHEAFQMERLPAVQSDDFERFAELWPSAVRRGRMSHEKMNELANPRSMAGFEHRWTRVVL